ncbi:MAG: 23S rRNA (adenine(2503)-C(2))-methyltransferase RlmN [Planctomycetota bacterium]
MSDRVHLLALDREALASLLADLGQPRFRVDQVHDWIHAKRVADFDAMRNVPKALRAALAARADLRTLEPLEHRTSRDGLTEKWLFRTADGHGVETVLIRDRDSDRRTVCVSSALGCPLGCRFCASAEGPYVRPLAPGEMVEQVARVADLAGEAATNVVFMGTGEPFLAYDEVLAAARRLNAEDGFGIGARHITVSTVGVIPGIERFAAEPEDFRLAISLHAPTQTAREKIIPAARRWPLGRLLGVVRRFTRERRREVTFEYILIDGFNAHVHDADRLAEQLRDIPCKVNCIPFNPVPGGAWTPPARDTCRAFVARIEQHGLRATLRTEKGADIQAACGQLRARRLCRTPTNKEE